MTAGIATTQPAAAALDALALAVLVVDRHGHILHANREAADLLDRPDGALLGQPATCGCHGIKQPGILHQGTRPQGTRHLGTRQAEGRSRLHALIQAACDGRPGEAVGFLQLEGGGPDEPGVSVCVSPLVETEAPGRALVVARLLRAQGRIEVQLRTRAEAQVGAALARGGCLAEIATELGISVTTARTHVARIFLKTGTRQQSQLVALVASVQLPVAYGVELAAVPVQALRSSR